MVQLTRLATAIIFAPLAAPVLSIFFSSGGAWPSDLSGIGTYVGVGAFVAFLGLLLFGLPALVLLRRLGRMTLVNLMVAGMVSGVLVFQAALFFLVVSLNSTSSFDWSTVMHGALIGGAVAFLFGLIAGVENLAKDSFGQP